MRRKNKRTINRVGRPTHPGRSIYTCILHNKMPVGEVAAVIGRTRTNFVHVLKGKARLSSDLAFLLAELFGWDLCQRWYIMQSKCDMYYAGVRIRKARRAMLNADPSDFGTDEWEEEVKQAWELVEQDVPDEKSSYPVLEPEDFKYFGQKPKMKEELDGCDKDGVGGGGDDGGAVAGRRNQGKEA